MKRFFPLFSLLCLAVLPVFSQSRSQFRVQKFTTETGLPSNGIKGLQWDDETGFLWIATEAGIVRYNGMEFKTFNKEDEPHITNERILFLVKNNDGKIFTADNVGNLFSVERNKIKFLEQKKFFTGAGNSFISLSASEQLYKQRVDFKKHAFALQFNPVLPLNDTSVFVVAANQLYYYSQSSSRPALVPGIAIAVSYGFKMNDEIFLTGQEKNIYRFSQTFRKPVAVQWDPTANMTNDELQNGHIVWENGMKHPIFFSNRKAWLLNYKDGIITPTLICDELPEDALMRYAQYDEKRKALFIGTDSKGLLIIQRNLVQSWKTANAPDNARTSYYAQVELTDGNILTSEGHIVGSAASSLSKAPIKGKFSFNTMMIGDSLLLYSQPAAAFQPDSSFFRIYNFNTGVTKVYRNIKENYQLVMATGGKDIYFSRDSGIYRLAGDSFQLLYPYDTSRKSGMDYDMKEIAPGIFLIANCNSLLRFDVKQKKLDTLAGPGNYCFRTIWKYNDYVFLGTYGGGLFIYKNGIIKPLPLDKNKYLLFTHCFIKDDKGFCWISTNRGLFKASLTELTDVFDKNTSEVYYYYYGKNDGMDMTELNGGCLPCALVKKDKTISFPTMDGLLWVNPENALPVLPKGEIYIDNVSIDNRKVNPDSFNRLQLPARTKEIVIWLGIAAWGNKENIYVDYKLNDEDSWRPVDIDRGMELRFNNLPSGDYQLMIRKRNGFGANNYTYRQLAFHITIPWYKKWWFYLLVGLSAAGAFMLYFNIRTRQLRMKQWRLEVQVADKTKELQQKNEVLEKNDIIKTRLISIISHDLVTPLKFLTAGGKNLIDKKALMTEDLQTETLREMVNTSQELQLLSTNILNWIKYQNENRRLAKEYFNVHDLANQVLSILNSMAKQKNISLKNELPFVAIYQYYEPLKILIYNLVSNAINFTDRGSIIISGSRGNGDMTLFVKDEGVGMSPEQIQNIMGGDQFIVSSANIDNRKGNGLGYLIIKDLLKLMGASFNIQSEKGKGTTVSIYMKTDGNGHA